MQTVQPFAAQSPQIAGDAASVVADQRPALEALAHIATACAHLPMADFHIGAVYVNTLTISLHDDLSGFERWREALGILASAVEYRALTHNLNLKAITTFAGATVELVGYAPMLSVVAA